MEHRYLKLRQSLDDLGYRQHLHIDSIPLVEKMLADLVKTTESLRKYMKLAEEVVEERDTLKYCAEPYKCDNAKLIKECNDLHLAFLQYKEQSEKTQKDLKRRICSSEKENNDLSEKNEKLKQRIRELELESAKKTDQIISCKCRPIFGSRQRAQLVSNFEQKKKVFKSKSEFELNSAMALAEEKIAFLSNEVRKLKDEQLHLIDFNATLENQLKNRDKEIQRLTELLEGGRPIGALNQDCCYKDIQGKFLKMQDEIENLQRVKSDFEQRLRDSVAKQHEAMKRALNLAERNKILESEMCDIDRMALAVEAECNNTIKQNAEKVVRLQERVHETVSQLQGLEREVVELKRDKQELLADLDAIKLEKKHLQGILEKTLEDKKTMTDKINNFTIIEKDLNIEIDRLVQISANQKRKIAELECKGISAKFDGNHDNLEDYGHLSKRNKKKQQSGSPRKKKQKSPENKNRSPSPKQSGKHKNKKNYRSRQSSPEASDALTYDVPRNTPKTPRTKKQFDSFKEFVSNNNSSNCKSPQVCVEHMKKMFDEYFNQKQCNCTKESALVEKEFYKNRISEESKNVPTKLNESNDLKQQLNEKEQLILVLQQENRCLAQEKHNLMTRLETARDRLENEIDGISLKGSLKRLERENELLKGDLLRLEEERDALRHRIKVTNENISTDHLRIQRNIEEYEEQIRKLEQERRDLMHNQGSRRATISTLEEQCEQLKEQLRLCQSDLAHQKALYSQIKSLQDQTDRALADSQGQIRQLEKELEHTIAKNKELEHNALHLREEISKYKEDLMIMKGNMAKIDSEKDSLLLSLDDKTEKIALLDQELKGRENKVMLLETTIDELKSKMSKSVDDVSSKEHNLMSLQAELFAVKNELEATKRGKELALQENRRIQDELAACTNDSRNANNELQQSKKQVNDLKRQLQHYVSEVKKTEDLISQKEIERSDMLDQFKTLSQEAAVLENSNHTLESEASQTRVQLSVALNHASDLERHLEGQEAMIKSYERQVSELTSQVASLEIQLKQNNKIQEQLENELQTTKDLCVKLDKQKDNLFRELEQKEHVTNKLDRDFTNLRKNSAALQEVVLSNQNTVENIEKLLNDCRRENTQLKLTISDQQEEINKNMSKIKDLQSKLSVTTEQLDLYQEKALDYSQQNKQLRREIANDRFHRSRPEESSSRICPRSSSSSYQQTTKAMNNSSTQSGFKNGSYTRKEPRSDVKSTLTEKLSGHNKSTGTIQESLQHSFSANRSTRSKSSVDPLNPINDKTFGAKATTRRSVEEASTITEKLSGHSITTSGPDALSKKSGPESSTRQSKSSGEASNPIFTKTLDSCDTSQQSHEEVNSNLIDKIGLKTVDNNNLGNNNRKYSKTAGQHYQGQPKSYENGSHKSPLHQIGSRADADLSKVGENTQKELVSKSTETIITDNDQNNKTQKVDNYADTCFPTNVRVNKLVACDCCKCNNTEFMKKTDEFVIENSEKQLISFSKEPGGMMCAFSSSSSPITNYISHYTFTKSNTSTCVYCKGSVPKEQPK